MEWWVWVAIGIAVLMFAAEKTSQHQAHKQGYRSEYDPKCVYCGKRLKLAPGALTSSKRMATCHHCGRDQPLASEAGESTGVAKCPHCGKPSPCGTVHDYRVPENESTGEQGTSSLPADQGQVEVSPVAVTPGQTEGPSARASASGATSGGSTETPSGAKILLGAVVLVAIIVGAVALLNRGGFDPIVPDVVGERLDLAGSHVEDAGLEYEVVGGGVFGVIEEDNWLVCDQEPVGATSDKPVKLIVDRPEAC